MDEAHSSVVPRWMWNFRPRLFAKIHAGVILGITGTVAFERATLG